MNINKKLVLKIVAVIIVLVLIVSLILFFKKASVQVENIPPVVNVVDEAVLPTRSDVKAVEDVEQIKAAPPVTSDEIVIKNTAKYIAEKFGSYSTDTFDFVNLQDAKYLATDSLKSYIDGLIENYRKKVVAGEYYGVTTKSLSIEILNPESIIGDKIVKTVVSTQRSETFGSDNPTISTNYKKAEIEIVKVGDQWLANRIEWK